MDSQKLERRGWRQGMTAVRSSFAGNATKFAGFDTSTEELSERKASDGQQVMRTNMQQMQLPAKG